MTTTMNVFRLFFITFLCLGVRNEVCPPLFQRYSQRHTYCLPPNRTCNIQRSKVRPSDIVIILKEHNVYRSRVATGEETTYSLPSASNMLEMVWDDELASVAQRHADQCVFEHDCNECRRVQNFDVGQNLYQRHIYPKVPEPSWPAAVRSWYDEVEDFKEKEQIDSFRDGEGPPPTGHFTQVVWAKTWRVGCGYAMHKTEKEYVDLYSCNYGPAGNVQGERIYEKGEPCSSCPINSCCGKSCLTQSYPGLCKISGDKPPQYKADGEYIFSCTFNDEADCARKTTGVDRWKIYKTLSGSYIGTVLNGGESTTLNFTTPFKGKKALCLTSYYRKGPQVAGQEGTSTARQIITIPKADFTFEPELDSNSVDFIKVGVTLNWILETLLSISFSVPAGKPPQYLELKDIGVTEGPC